MQTDLNAILDQLRTYLPQHQPTSVVERGGCSNLVTEVWFDSRRAVLIKRARHPHLTVGVDCERAAALLLLNRSNIAAPIHFPTSNITAEVVPLYLAYWRIPMPTLSELWRSLSAQQRRIALRSLGSLMRALHRVRVPSFGRLPEALSGSRTLAAFLHEDLAYRLLPAVRSGWEAGVPLVSNLVDYLPSVVQRLEGRFPILTHGDLFAGNVLCANQSGRCEGLIDLEDATANIPEADIARLELLHGPMMGHPWCGDWMEEVLVGYAARPDPLILRFYAAYHLANFAFMLR